MTTIYDVTPGFTSTSNVGPRIDPQGGTTIRVHNGIDYGAATGTAVPAAAGGIAMYSGLNGTPGQGYGNTVIIQDSAGYFHLAAHMNGVGMPAVGTTVARGDVIGQVGSTGFSTGPHLHYEVLTPGAPVATASGGEIGVAASNTRVRVDPNSYTPPEMASLPPLVPVASGDSLDLGHFNWISESGEYRSGIHIPSIWLDLEELLEESLESNSTLNFSVARYEDGYDIWAEIYESTGNVPPSWPAPEDIDEARGIAQSPTDPLGNYRPNDFTENSTSPEDSDQLQAGSPSVRSGPGNPGSAPGAAAFSMNHSQILETLDSLIHRTPQAEQFTTPQSLAMLVIEQEIIGVPVDSPIA